MAKNVLFLLFVSLTVLANAENDGTWLFSILTKAPAPTDPCADIVYNMMDCMDFLTLDQPANNKPTASCCTGFQSVLAVSPLCVCEAVKTARDIGLDLNLTRAAQLPALCGDKSFDDNLCQANAAPPPHGSSTTTPPPAPAKMTPTTPPHPHPPAPAKKAPSANPPSSSTSAQTASGSSSLNTVSAMIVCVVGFVVSFY